MGHIVYVIDPSLDIEVQRNLAARLAEFEAFDELKPSLLQKLRSGLFTVFYGRPKANAPPKFDNSIVGLDTCASACDGCDVGCDIGCGGCC